MHAWGEDHQWELNPRGTMELWASNSFLGALTHGIVKEQNDMPGEQLLVMFDALHVDYDAFTADKHAGLVKSQRKVRIRDAHGNLLPGLLIVKVATAAPFTVTVLVNTMHTRAQLDAAAAAAAAVEAKEAKEAAAAAAEVARTKAQAKAAWIGFAPARKAHSHGRSGPLFQSRAAAQQSGRAAERFTL
eukprot:COSAG03_NODE_7470_length_913_cov_4.567568_2_plen_188_part_00